MFGTFATPLLVLIDPLEYTESREADMTASNTGPRMAPEGQRKQRKQRKQQRGSYRCPGCGGLVIGKCMVCEIRTKKRLEKLTAKGLT